MIGTHRTFPKTVGACAALTLVFLCHWQAPALRAQDVPDWEKPPLFPRDFVLTGPDAGPASSPTAPRGNRIRLFRVTPGFLSDPVGLDQDDTAAPTPSTTAPTDSGPDWIGLSLGNDNPFFDIRRPGDPGGVGYYRVHSQVQLFDTRRSACTFNLQAVTPAGHEQDGLADGPTVVTPSLAVYQELLPDGTAFQAYIGKQVHLAPGWTNGFSRSVHYAMAVQRPLIDADALKLGTIYGYVGALGRYRFDADPSSNNGPTWELMPGLHWQVSDNWWLATGFIVPMKQQSQTDLRLWQLTCSFRF
jgi:hypothetical protein